MIKLLINIFIIIIYSKAFSQNQANQLSLVGDKAQLIWKDDRLKLYRNAKSINKLPPLISIIKTQKSSNFASSLPENFIILRKSYNLNQDLIVLGVHSLDQLDPIVSELHEQLGVCGVAQTFSSQLKLAATSVFIPPAYSSMITLPTVSSLLNQIDQARVLTDISLLTSLGTRHHSTGTETPDLVESMFTESANGLSNIQISQQSHSFTTQTSVVARIEGSSTPSEKVILGAHLDSINPRDSTDAPGADDDASGIAILNEILRIISSQNLSFQKTIELHAYGAEEVGLIGSGDIANSYVEAADSIVSMMQLDMSLWGENGSDPTIWLIENDTSPDVTRSAVNLIKNYLETPFELAKLTEGTSDHKSWYDRGVPALFAFESPTSYNPYIHTKEDTEDKFNNLPLNLQISKLALLYLSHYAGLVSASSEYSELLPSAFTGTNIDVALAINSDSHLSVGVPASIEYVEVCSLENPAGLDCAGDRTILNEFLIRASRKIFIKSSPMTLDAGQKWRVWAYDQEHSLISKRDIQLEAL